jgi:hypothetical protein
MVTINPTQLLSQTEWSLLAALHRLGKPSRTDEIARLVIPVNRWLSDSVAQAILERLQSRGFVSSNENLWGPSHLPLAELLRQQLEYFLQEYALQLDDGLDIVKAYLQDRKIA